MVVSTLTILGIGLLRLLEYLLILVRLIELLHVLVRQCHVELMQKMYFDARKKEEGVL